MSLLCGCIGDVAFSVLLDALIDCGLDEGYQLIMSLEGDVALLAVFVDGVLKLADEV